MTGTGDHDPEMPAAPLLDEVTIDAILHGDDAPHGVRNLAAFAAGVMAVGEEPPPQPSPQLAAFLAHGAPTLAVERATVVVPAVTRRRSALARVAGVSLVAKISVATTAAAAGVVGAGAAGMLPGPAGGFVRDAIEVVTPVEFTDDDPGGGPDRGDADPSDEPGTAPGDLGDAQVPSLPGEHGDRVSSDATGESDGDPGVDGPTVAEQAPGATHTPPVPPDGPGATPPTTTPQGVPGAPGDTPGATAPGSGDTPGATAPGATAPGSQASQAPGDQTPPVP